MIYFILLVLFDALSVTALTRLSPDKTKMFIKYNALLLSLLFMSLLFSQMIMYPPGSDVSPYAYTKGMLKHITIFGRTYSSWFSMLFAGCCVMALLLNENKTDRFDITVLTAALIVFAVGILRSDSILGALSNGTKFILPFIVYFYIKSRPVIANGKSIENILGFTNIILILQVIISKIFTGSFAASRYYLQMDEEYFGFFNHPHNFTGLLGVCSIWCIYNINNKKNQKQNILLLLCNIVLMYVSGSRSYVYALLATMGYIIFMSFTKSELKSVRKYAYVAIAITVFFGGALLSHLGAGRGTDSANLSGRGERWLGDLAFYATRMDFVKKLLGGGFGYVNDVNKILSGVYINSLNIFIDFLIDTGIVGALLMVFAFGGIFYYFIKQRNRVFSIATAVFFVLASFATNLLDYQMVTIYMILMLFAMKGHTDKATKNERKQKKLL